MKTNTWHPIAEWQGGAPGEQSFADLWVVGEDGIGFRAPDAWFSLQANEWMIANERGGSSDPISMLGVVPTHFMIVEGPGE